LFRYGGEPTHPLSWFGPATREQRQLSVDVFAEALANERRTRRLIDASVDFAVDVKRLMTWPLLRPMRPRVMNILRSAGLLFPAGHAVV
jgi:hypothetical protein